MIDDKTEWDEALHLIADGSDVITSDLSFGTYVTMEEELFHTMIEEINAFRIKYREGKDDVTLITVSDENDNEY